MIGSDSTPDADTVRTFSLGWRYFWPVVAAIGLLSVVPATSVWELVTTGQIDLEAVSEGRWRLPIWVLHLIGWILFIPTLPILLYPLLKYPAKGWVFKIADDAIIIDAQIIHFSEIKSIKETVWGMRISTSDKRYYFHPRMGVSGYEAFAAYNDAHSLKFIGSASPRA